MIGAAVAGTNRRRRLGPTRPPGLDVGPGRDRVAVAVLAAIVVIGLAIAAGTGTLIAGSTVLPGYNDGQAHLVLGRQITNGAATGPAGFGSVWLPIPTALYGLGSLVFVWWQTGVAGVLVGGASSAFAAERTYVLVRLCGGARAAALAAAAVLAVNPSWGYLSLSAMTEPMAFAAFLWFGTALARFARAGRSWSGGELAVRLGVPAALGVLCRYEGWAVAVFGGAAVAATSWARLAAPRLNRPAKRLARWRAAVRPSLRAAALFAIVPTVAAIGWVWQSWRVSGDPLGFARGERSARGQQELLEAAGRLPALHNWTKAASLVAEVSVQVVGATSLILIAVAAAVFALFARRDRLWWAPAAVCFVLPFEVLSLWAGQTAVTPAWTIGESVFNVRYGLAMVPVLSLAVAALVTATANFCADRELLGGRPRSPRWAPALALALLVSAAASWWPADASRTGVIYEAATNLAGTTANQTAAAETRRRMDQADPSRMGADRSTGAGIVGFDETANAVAWPLGVDLDRVANDSDTITWRDLTADPTSVEWILVNRSGTTVSGTPDRLGYAIEQYGPARFSERMELVWSHDGWQLYHRRTGATP
jgi:hypothetical protein